MEPIMLDDVTLEEFYDHLFVNEYAFRTIKKYSHDLRVLSDFSGGVVSDKTVLIQFKQYLKDKGYALTSINSMLGAVNCFLVFREHSTWKLSYYKLQKAIFFDETRELTFQDYEQLVKTARDEGNQQDEMLVLTFGSAGPRVSEAQSVTVESLSKHQAITYNKGAERTTLLPRQLCQTLAGYCESKGIRQGPVFATRSGKPLDRSYIWKRLKSLAKRAGVDPRRVFPHNFRHLFARTYYAQYKDLAHLADILGHRSTDTTRIYTAHSYAEEQRQIEGLPLLI